MASVAVAVAVINIAPLKIRMCAGFSICTFHTPWALTSWTKALWDIMEHSHPWVGVEDNRACEIVAVFMHVYWGDWWELWQLTVHRIFDIMASVDMYENIKQLWEFLKSVIISLALCVQITNYYRLSPYIYVFVLLWLVGTSVLMIMKPLAIPRSQAMPPRCWDHSNPKLSSRS